MPVVDLGTLEGGHFLGLIVPCSSGVEWTNQVGGVSCQHPKVEGIYIPLPVHWEPYPDPLLDWYGNYKPYRVEEFLEAAPELLKRFAVLESYPDNECFGEAWVPVTIQVSPEDAYGPLLTPFFGRAGIITYTNSD